jgi:short-subunit dehydrogenase
MDDFGGKIAVITGAGSGIGRALAVELARRGAHLALADVDETGLAETLGRAEGLGVKVTATKVDVADRSSVFAWADEVVAQHGAVHLVFNNAGVALSSTIEAMTYDDLEWLMGVNFWGVVHGTKAFLPHVKASGDGHIINISSVFGLVSVPTQAAYNASKFAVRGFTDCLRMELEIEGCGVSCTTVHPGGIRTNIARNMRLDASAADMAKGVGDRFDLVARTSPEKAARVILRAVERDKRRVLVGADAKLIDVVSRLPASVYQRAVVRGARRRQR